MVLQFQGPFEGSGTVLTTILNHLGSFMIASSVLTYLADCDPSPDAISAAFVKGAALVGHVVTNDPCIVDSLLSFEHVQFLKRSPFRTPDGWKPYVNLGCILRSFGTVEDDLDHIKCGISHAQFMAYTHEQRANLFFSNVVRGWKNEPSNPIMNALRQRFNTGTAEITPDSLKHIFTEVHDLSSYDNTPALMSRYGVTMDELNELAEAIMHIKVGMFTRTAAAAKIYNVDYGVGYIEF